MGIVNPFVYPAQIKQDVQGTDTTYTEYPRHSKFVKGVPRTASSSDVDRSEYNILKKRFDTAWGNATPMTW